MRITFAFLTLASLLSGCFTAGGAIAGGLHAARHNRAVDNGLGEDRTSIAKEAAIGAALGLVVDLAIAARTLDSIPSEAIGRRQ